MYHVMKSEHRIGSHMPMVLKLPAQKTRVPGDKAKQWRMMRERSRVSKFTTHAGTITRVYARYKNETQFGEEFYIKTILNAIPSGILYIGTIINIFTA